MNKKIPFMSLFLILAFLLLSVSISPVQAYERQDLIDSSVFIIRVSNVSDFIKAIERSSLGQLWNSKEMKPFLNNQSLAEALKKTLLHSVYGEKPNNKALSHLLWEGLKLLKKELVVGISLPGKEGKTNFFIAAAMDKPDYLKGMEIDERMAELDEDQSVPQKQMFQGVELYRSDETVAPGVKESEWSAFYGGTMITGSNREWVERCIVRLKNELPKTPAGPPTLHLRITSRFIADIFEEESQSPIEEQEPGTEEIESPTPGEPDIPPAVILKALGLDHLKHITVDFILKPEAMEFQFHIKTTGAGGNKGLWTLLSREQLPPKHRLAYVPDDVYTYQVMRLDFNALWKELPEILKAIDPQTVQYLQAAEGMFGGMYQIDLSRDIFGNLGTLITTFARMEGMKKQELLALQLRQAEAMEKLLVKLFGEGTPLKAQMQDRLEIYELHGHKLYSFKTGPVEPGPTLPQQAKEPLQEPAYIGVSVVDGALVFGTEKLVRSLIQAASTTRKSSTNTFYQHPSYTTLIRQVPDDAVGFAITDISRLLRPMLELFKNPLMIQTLKMESQQDKEKSEPSPLTEFFDNLRFDRLPPVDFMASFFGRGVSYTRFDGNDLSSRGIFQYREKK
ncbi:MAG: hypothetical protein JSV88_03025 [Candidatus Aminicenantes bacterium]|nr:MAG: hypothetical protein JSV88_03025 [Candidatus Aminicenantes bacterium]